MKAHRATPDSRNRGWRHSWDVLVVLFSRDLKVLYKRSVIGTCWALAGPLLQLVVYTTLFKRVLAAPIANYPSHVFTGVLLWAWFQSSLTQSAGLITGSKALVKQPGFPLTLLPVVTVAVRLFHFAVALPILFGLLWWNGVRPSLPWLLLPGLMCIQILLTVGIAYPLASANVIFRDTQHIVGAVLQIAMFMTPVFYSVHSIPERLRPLYYLNPMVTLMEAWRDVLLRGSWPNLYALGIWSTVGVLLWILGRSVFVSQSHRFVEEL